MKLVPYHGVLFKEYVGEILKSFDKFQVVPSSMKVFPTNFNGHLSPTVSRPSEGRADRDTVGTGYAMVKHQIWLIWSHGGREADLNRLLGHLLLTWISNHMHSKVWDEIN